MLRIGEGDEPLMDAFSTGNVINIQPITMISWNSLSKTTLPQAGLRFRKVLSDGDVIFTTAFSLDAGTFEVYLIVDHTFQTVTLLINFSISVPEPKRITGAEYLTRVNYHSREGSIKLDFSDGMLCYCYVLSFDQESDLRHIAYQLDVSLATGIDELESYFPGILAVIYRDIKPVQAIAEVEFQSNPKFY